MRLAALVFALGLCACGSYTGSGPTASASRTATASTARAATPSAPTGTTTLNCSVRPIATHAMALTYNYDPMSPLFIVDVSDPIRPVPVCKLDPAQGGRFLSATTLAFWAGDTIGTADLLTGHVVQTARLSSVAASVAFSADGSRVAYRVYSNAGAVATHLLIAGTDRTLYNQEAMGGHGGPGPDFGPVDQLQFSPDGTELLDYMLFRPTSGPANLTVFTTGGATVFQQSGLGPAVWAATGSLLYFRAAGQNQAPAEVDSIDANGQRRVVATGLSGYWWPSLSPDGQAIVYNAPDNSVPDCGGLPHVWRLDLHTGTASQVSKSITSRPVFVGPNVLWSNEEKQVDCGPGGPSAPDGTVLAHDMSTGRDSAVDSNLYQAVAGGQENRPLTDSLIDVKL